MRSSAPARLRGVDAIELFYTAILVLVFFLVTWFALYAVYKLYKGQS